MTFNIEWNEYIEVLVVCLRVLVQPGVVAFFLLFLPLIRDRPLLFLQQLSRRTLLLVDLLLVVRLVLS